MNSAGNVSERKIFCLFHEKAECGCEAPVKNQATLIYRLIQEVKANKFLILNSTDKEVKAKLQKETDMFQARLDKLTGGL